MTDFIWNKIDYGNVLIRALDRIIDPKIPILDCGKELSVLRGYLAYQQSVFDTAKKNKMKLMGFEYGHSSFIYKRKTKNHG